MFIAAEVYVQKRDQVDFLIRKVIPNFNWLDSIRRNNIFKDFGNFYYNLLKFFLILPQKSLVRIK